MFFFNHQVTGCHVWFLPILDEAIVLYLIVECYYYCGPGRSRFVIASRSVIGIQLLLRIYLTFWLDLMCVQIVVVSGQEEDEAVTVVDPMVEEDPLVLEVGQTATTVTEEAVAFRSEDWLWSHLCLVFCCQESVSRLFHQQSVICLVTLPSTCVDWQFDDHAVRDDSNWLVSKMYATILIITKTYWVTLLFIYQIELMFRGCLV